MADWRTRASIRGDVVSFIYVSDAKAQDAKYVFVWDLDKTYLDTQFETLKGLYRTIIEKAFQKRNIPGTSSLVRALTRSADDFFPIYFVTASPPQMEEKIREKLELDGLKAYGVFCKDNLKNLRPSRFRRLGQQVGYKLQALMQLRQSLNADVKQILWGDDSESDAVIYALYSDICARRLSEASIRQILTHYHVRGDQLDLILKLQSSIPVMDPVYKVYINLASDTDPDYYSKFGRRTLATFNSFQIAVDLYQESILNWQQLLAVAQDLLVNYAFSSDELGRSLDDLIQRKVLVKNIVLDLVERLKTENLIPSNFKINREPISNEDYEKIRSSASSRDVEKWIPEHIDYLHDFR